MHKSWIKNVIIVILGVVCTVLAVRLWFGAFSLDMFFPSRVAASTAPHLHDEAVSARVITLASLRIQAGDVHFAVRGQLSSHPAWNEAGIAIGQLIEGGVFARSGVADDAFWASLPNAFISVEYNFPMSSTFFRESFATRSGFLSSHFDYFYTLIIAPAHNPYTLDFTFVQGDGFYVFSLNHLALHQSFVEFLDDAAASAPSTPHAPAAITSMVPISEITLSGVRNYLYFLFPSPPAYSPIGGAWVYRDARRIARFFPDNTLEFNAAPAPSVSTAGGDLIHALHIALAIINKDKVHQAQRDAKVNEITLANHYYNAATGRWHFYFNYILSNYVIDTGREGYALSVQVLGDEVVFYRRLMVYFLAEGLYEH